MIRQTSNEDGRNKKDRAIDQIRVLADYAQTRHLDTVSELLVDLLAVVCTRVGSMTADDIRESEKLQVRMRRALDDLDRSDTLDRRTEQQPPQPAQYEAAVRRDCQCQPL